MLDQLADQFNQVVLVVESALLERLELRHLLSNIVLLEWHKLKGEELADILGKQLVSLEFTGIHGFNHVKIIDFLLSVW